jgi:hypothetical protein
LLTEAIAVNEFRRRVARASTLALARGVARGGPWVGEPGWKLTVQFVSFMRFLMSEPDLPFVVPRGTAEADLHLFRRLLGRLTEGREVPAAHGTAVDGALRAAIRRASLSCYQ